jgi:cell division protein ZapA (FtsZ GTPase activity inhibitor)
MIWAVLVTVGLLSLLLFIKKREGRLEERLSSSEEALEAAKTRVEIETANNLLTNDELRDKLRKRH